MQAMHPQLPSTDPLAPYDAQLWPTSPPLQARLREANERRQQEERERLERERAEREAVERAAREARAKAEEEDRRRRDGCVLLASMPVVHLLGAFARPQHCLPLKPARATLQGQG